MNLSFKTLLAKKMHMQVLLLCGTNFVAYHDFDTTVKAIAVFFAI